MGTDPKNGNSITTGAYGFRGQMKGKIQVFLHESLAWRKTWKSLFICPHVSPTGHDEPHRLA